MKSLFGKVQSLLGHVSSWVIRKGPIGFAVAAGVAIVVVFSGVGVTMAATGGLASKPSKTATPPPSPTPTATNSDANTSGIYPITDPNAVNFSSGATNTDPGEYNAYGDHSSGIHVYFTPTGVRIAISFKCLSSTSDTIVYSGLPTAGTQAMCLTTRPGSGLGVSNFYPQICGTSISSTITVRMHGTNIDGTYSYPVPDSLLNSCSSQIVTGPSQPQAPAPAPAPSDSASASPSPSASSSPTSSASPSN